MQSREAFHANDILPASLHAFLSISEIDNADFVARALFKKKFGHPVPDMPHHLVALYRDDEGALHLAGYSHMRPFGDVYLSGGSCTNGETLRRMQTHEADAIRAAGGVWYWLLKYAFAKYADRCDAFFGHCGAPRALEVALEAGFEPTEHLHVIAHWHKPLHPSIRRALIAKVHALGAF